jgi:SH3 domain protein
VKRAIFLILMLVAGLAHADTVRYVTDQLRVMLRSGTSLRHQVIKQIATGTALTVLDSDPQTHYSKVRTPDGTEGWLLTRYLTDKQPPREQLAATEKKLSALENTVTQLRQQLNAATAKSSGATKQVSSLTEQNNTLTQQLAELRRVSGNAVQIVTENRNLKSRITELEREGQLLRQENASLKDRSKRDWFIVGAIVVVISMLFGILLTRIRWRKRSGWGDL